MDSAYTVKPTLTGLLKATQVVMYKWEQDTINRITTINP